MMGQEGARGWSSKSNSNLAEALPKGLVSPVEKLSLGGKGGGQASLPSSPRPQRRTLGPSTTLSMTHQIVLLERVDVMQRGEVERGRVGGGGGRGGGGRRGGLQCRLHLGELLFVWQALLRDEPEDDEPHLVTEGALGALD